MEEEIPTIRVVFVGDKKIGNHIVKFFKEKNKKCFNHVTAVDFYVMSMKIKDFKDVNFNIIILKSFNHNDNDNFYKKILLMFLRQFSFRIKLAKNHIMNLKKE